MKKSGFFYRAFDLYYEGFKNMTLGKTLWTVIIIKLLIMFCFLKPFLFPNHIKQNAAKGQEDKFVATEMLERDGNGK
ncbi:DUF4492 domain-containing protein [Prevotella sp. HUN102]|uniref:DUF4492 domain-containing protein n=1 Tax=Prevotella sp. HUN102 TaxID=1392486 RepID=UPI00048F0FF9|nr:DUF4492 domain-containing protein [Prevotella sp. HUN102]